MEKARAPLSRQSRRRDLLLRGRVSPVEVAVPSTSRPITPMGMADQPLSPAPPAASMENKPPP